MTDTKHTPGPWALAPDGTIRSQAFGTSDMMGDHRGCIVCDLKAGTGSNTWPASGRTHAQPEAEANARLIAAAPELLEAVEYLLLFCHTQFDGRNDGHAAIKEARSVVARARGRELAA